MGANKKQKEDSFIDVVRLIIRRRWIFFIGSVGFAILALLVSLLLPVKYTATATFESRTDTVVEYSGETKNQTFRVAKMTLRQELAGVNALKKAIDELGIPYSSEEEKDAKARLFSNLIKIYWRVNTDNVDLIQVEFSHSDPAIAEGIPNVLVRNYIKRISQKIVDQLQRSKEFVVKQVRASDEKIAKLKKKEIEIISRYGLDVSDKPGQVRDEIIRINTEIESLKRQQKIAQSKIERLKKLLRMTRLRELYNEKTLVENKIATLLSEYCMSEHHPQVISLKIRLRQIEQKINRTKVASDPENLDFDEKVDAILTDIATAKSEIATLDGEIHRLEIRRNKYEELLSNLGPILYQYSHLESQLREELLQNNRWRNKLTALESAIKAEEVKCRTQLSTIQPAKSPYRPVSPRLWTVLFFAVAGGITFGYVLTFGIENADHTIHSPEEAAKTFDLPVVGVVDEILTPTQKTLRKVRQKTVSLVVISLLLGGFFASVGSVTLRLKYPNKYHKLVSIFKGTGSNTGGIVGNN